MNDPDFSYELLFDLTPDLFCLAGFDGYFKRINPAVSKVLEYTTEELYSRPINDFVHPDDRVLTQEKRAMLHEASPLLHFENRYISKSGKIVWLSWTSWPIPEKRLVFAIAKVVTHKKKEEFQRNELLATLTQSNQEMKNLSYITAHDLRSPVNSLLAIFGLLEIEKIENPEHRELIQLIQFSTENLKETLNKYLQEISEKGQEKKTVEIVNFSEVLSGVVQSIHPLIQNSGAVIESDFSQSGEIRFNRLYLESIYLNLLSNSIKYAKPCTAPKITIRSEKQNQSVQLIIEDNGLGFDLEKTKDKIFRLNQTFHQHEDSKGVGLYLVYNHVTNMGGRIDVESEVNKGTRFIITF